MKFRFVLVLFSIFSFSQNNQLWKSYYSYNEIVDVAQTSNQIYAATVNSVFFNNSNQQDFNFINSINGFKPEEITCIHVSETHQKIIVGNTNGLLLIANPDGTTINKVDIIEEVPVAPNKKRINHLYEYNNKIYIATDYGISEFNLTTLEFGTTYFIGTAGQETKVFATTVLNNEIYAVTQNYGIRKGDLSNPFLYDYSQWQTFDSGSWSNIITYNNQLIAQNSGAGLYRYNGSSFVQILNTIEQAKTLKTNQLDLIITTPNRVFVLNQSFIQLAYITSIPDYDVTFSAATVVGDKIYIGTTTEGLFTTDLSNPFNFENLTPNGPYQNYIFRVRKAPNKLWTVYGNYTFDYNPYPLDELPVSYYTTAEGWSSIPYADLLGAKSLSDIAFNPNNPNEVFISSYFSGLVKIDEESILLYDDTNTGTNGLESLSTSSTDIRINSPAFDKMGNLWVTNRGTDLAVKVLRSNGQWQSYNIGDYITSGRFAPMAIDKNNTKWLPTRGNGVVAFNDTQNNKTLTITADDGLDASNAFCVAVDNNDQLWIGTNAGLRILSSVNQFLQQNELTVSNIVIQEGDLAQELFYEQTVVDIAVDGANRKWVAIDNGGVFLVSANGQQTIYNFTKKNSPLPSNNVNDIEIDGVTGEVYFATDKGMVSFLGVSTKPSNDLSEVYVYPNPVRPNYTGTIKISGLTDKANVKITDIEGNLVYETTSAGGTIEWNGTAFGSHQVASGVYMVFAATQDGTDTTVKKIMIIR
ncbi:T9SS type A sorting domain-containing protein [Flavobacterium sp.]|uniref:type IX secretion system anionic LPS delivery protein PorZ n=1 Tax=Flavobacterium sp. TaxID=239 RepID=UPI003527ECAB